MKIQLAVQKAIDSFSRFLSDIHETHWDIPLPAFSTDCRSKPTEVKLELEIRNARNLKGWQVAKLNHEYTTQVFLSDEEIKTAKRLKPEELPAAQPKKIPALAYEQHKHLDIADFLSLNAQGLFQ